ncbi:MAG: hypothetical protein J5695_04265 [Bacteroidales bacterium]|nr:hypothetical protein [Bacteroidales bacterium]
MNKILKSLIAAGLLATVQTAALAQDFYLMPAFADGMVYFNNQRPAQGKLNISVLDNTLRFLDADGKELAATDNGNITKVRIDTVWFLHSNDAYYRMYPLAVGVGVALKHDLRVIPEAKKGAYGTTSQTSSINQKSVLYADGVTYNLNTDRKAQYEETDILFLYKDDAVLYLNKRNLRKVFPAHKEDIDAWFKAGNTIPDTLEELLPLLRTWTE